LHYSVNNTGFSQFGNFFRKKPKLSAPQVQSSVPLYKVKNTNPIKNILPTMAFVGSIMGSVGYILGGSSLLYDLHQDKKNTAKKNLESKSAKTIILSKFDNKTSKSETETPQISPTKKEDGVKSVKPSTRISKIGMNCTKVGITASSIAGVACGLSEGLPLMALGESTNIASAGIIETPVGTGLFGIGIASIFAGLALDNTPHSKLNPLDVMAAKGTKAKANIYLKNMKNTAKEIGSSVFEMAKNIYKPKWLKENIFQGTPRTVVFTEKINKEGKVFLEKSLRHNKNYLMNAASFTLALGGVGIIGSSFLKSKAAKKAQKAGLVVEEGGFLFDNVGITRYGVDKMTNGSKASGIPFAVGGIINAVSQFLGLDNKNGRALQWLGIAPVFLGYAVDRGKHLKQALKLAKQRPELTHVVREWKLNLANVIEDKKELKTLLKEIKTGKEITNSKFNNIESAITGSITERFKETDEVKKELSNKLENGISQHIHNQEVSPYNKTKEILEICTEKIFGSKTPEAIKG